MTHNNQPKDYAEKDWLDIEDESGGIAELLLCFIVAVACLGGIAAFLVLKSVI